MSVRNWCVFIRGNGGKGSKYYYSIKNPRTGKYLSHLSTRTSSKREAEKIAARAYDLYIAELNKVKLRTNMTLISFIETMYNEDESPLYLEKREHNSNALQSAHFRTQKSYFKRYLLKLIPKEMTIGKITPYDIDQLQHAVRVNNPLLTLGTINAIMASLISPLKYAASKWIIPKDPTEGYRPYKPDRKITGIFTSDEVNQLIKLHWDDENGKLAFLLAIHTGMRMGEILALRYSDIQPWLGSQRFIPVVHISHSFSKTHGLKCPKNGKSRIVPIPEWLWKELLALAGDSNDDTKFVFASKQTGKPLSDKIIRKAFEKALEQIGITSQEREERNLRFHSTRHYFNSALAPLVQNESLRKVIGHSSSAMTEHYHHTSDIELEMIAKAQSQAFQTTSCLGKEVIA
jgi:integrase